MAAVHTANRRAQILRVLTERGQVHVRDLVEQLVVSEMTIRRDLEHLAVGGHLIRTYGGARPAGQTVREQPYADKLEEHTEQKERIARRGAELVRDGAVILLDAGSTTAAMARYLRERKDLTVVTNDLKIALALSDEAGIRVLVTGGTAQPGGYNLYGPIAEQFLAGLTVDAAFLGTDAADLQQGITTPTLEKVSLKRAIIGAARRAVLLADAAKFGLRSPFQVCPLHAISHIISDTGLPAELARAIRKEGIELDLV